MSVYCTFCAGECLSPKQHKAKGYHKAGGTKQNGCPAPVELGEFMARKHAPLKFLVPDLILEKSISCIGGRPRGAKTPLLIQLGLSCAWGEPWCDGVTTPSTKTGVLHLGLERGEQVLQQQIRAHLDGKSVPSGFHVQWNWPRFDQGGIEGLDQWLGAHKDVGLVTLDPWVLLRPKDGKKDGVAAYFEDYDDINLLRGLRDKHGVAFLMSMHTNQNKEPIDMTASLYGNTGFAGALDMVGLVINKKQLVFEGTLIERQKWNMAFKFPRWVLKGVEDVDEAVVEVDDRDAHVLVVLNDLGPGSHPQSVVANKCDPKVMTDSDSKDAHRMAVKRSLNRLAKMGAITFENGMAAVATTPEAANT